MYGKPCGHDLVSQSNLARQPVFQNGNCAQEGSLE